MASSSVLTPVIPSKDIVGEKGVGKKVFGLFPFLFNHKTGKLYFVNSIKLNISFTPASQWPIVTTPNPSSALPKSTLISIENDEPNPPQKVYGPVHHPKHLIVTVDSLKKEYDKLAIWRTTLGVETKVVTMEEMWRCGLQQADTCLSLKQFLYEKYLEGYESVLLGGDVKQIPSRICAFLDYQPFDPPVETEPVPVDWYYVCFDKTFSWDTNGNGIYGEMEDDFDVVPEMAISRIPLSTINETKNFIKKLEDYESTPPLFISESNHSILLQGAKIDKYTIYNGATVSDSHFIAKNFYEKSIKPYTDIIPKFNFDTSSPDECGGSGFTETTIKNNLSSGPIMVFNSTHGNPSGWSMTDGKMFTFMMVNELNMLRPALFFDLACSTGYFDSPSFFAKHLLKQNTGAIGYFCNSRVGAGTNIQDDGSYQLGATESYWETMLPTILTKNWANQSLGKTFLEQKRDKGLGMSLGFDRYRKAVWVWGVYNLLGESYLRMPIDVLNTGDLFPCSVAEKNDFVSILYDNSRVGNVRIIYSYFDNGEWKCEVYENLRGFKLPAKDVYRVAFDADGYYPRVFLSEHIRNYTVTDTLHLEGGNITIGENVKVASGAHLSVKASNQIKILNNVKFEKGSTITLKTK